MTPTEKRIALSNQKWLKRDGPKKVPRKKNAWMTGPFRVFKNRYLGRSKSV